MKQGQIITLQKNQYIVKSDDVKLVESSWKKIIQKIKEDKNKKYTNQFNNNFFHVWEILFCLMKINKLLKRYYQEKIVS